MLESYRAFSVHVRSTTVAGAAWASGEDSRFGIYGRLLRLQGRLFGRLPPRDSQSSVRPRLWRRLLWILRDISFITSDTVELMLLRMRASSKASDDRPKLALVYVHGIGDLVLLLGTLEELLTLFPRDTYRITLVCSSAAKEFAQRYLAVDEIIDVDRVRLRRDLSYRWRTIRDLAQAGFSVALQPSLNRDLLIEDSFVRATGAAQRIGSAGTAMFMGPLARRVGDRWYTRLVPTASRVMHDLERNAAFARGLGIRHSGVRRPLLPRPDRPARDARPAYAVFAVGSSSPLKTWPLSNFEWIANKLVKQRNIKVVFCAGPEGKIAQTDFADWNDDHFENRTGLTSLSDLMALLAGAKVVVGNDSASIHLAAALGVPSLCIVGGGIVDRYHPYSAVAPRAVTDPVPVSVAEPMPCFNCGWMCRYDVGPGDPAPCIERVERTRVLEALLAVLEQSAGRPAPCREHSVIDGDDSLAVDRETVGAAQA